MGHFLWYTKKNVNHLYINTGVLLCCAAKVFNQCKASWTQWFLQGNLIIQKKQCYSFLKYENHEMRMSWNLYVREIYYCKMCMLRTCMLNCNGNMFIMKYLKTWNYVLLLLSFCIQYYYITLFDYCCRQCDGFRTVVKVYHKFCVNLTNMRDR